MRKFRDFAAIILFVGATLSACSTHVYSPAIRTLPVETAATLPRGKVAVALEGGRTNVWNTNVFAGTARVRYGLLASNDLDLEVEANGLLLDTHDHAASLYGGVKYRLGKHVAVMGGVGGGESFVHAWGHGTLIAGTPHFSALSTGEHFGQLGGDIGSVVAFENRYVVPSLTTRIWVSVPVGAHAINLADSDSYVALQSYQFMTTIGWVATFGLRIPVVHGEGYDHFSFLAGLSIGEWTAPANHSHEGMLALHGGLEFAP